jgi:hypothetical protein
MRWGETTWKTSDLTGRRGALNRSTKLNEETLCLYVHSMMAQCLTFLTIRLLATLEAVEVVQDGVASPPIANGSGTC